MDQLGTYLYKELIMEVMEHLSFFAETDYDGIEELYASLKNSDADIYSYAASEYLEIGKNTYFKYLTKALKEANLGKEKDFASQTIDLGKQALNYKRGKIQVLSYKK